MHFCAVRNERLHYVDVSTRIWGGTAWSSESALHITCEGVCAEDEKKHLKTLPGFPLAQNGSCLFKQIWQKPPISQSVSVTRPRLSSTPQERPREMRGAEDECRARTMGKEKIIENWRDWAHCADLWEQNELPSLFPRRGSTRQSWDRWTDAGGVGEAPQKVTHKNIAVTAGDIWMRRRWGSALTAVCQQHQLTWHFHHTWASTAPCHMSPRQRGVDALIPDKS